MPLSCAPGCGRMDSFPPAITGAAVNARFDAIKCTLLFAKSDWNGGYLILREAVSCAFAWGNAFNGVSLCGEIIGSLAIWWPLAIKSERTLQTSSYLWLQYLLLECEDDLDGQKFYEMGCF